MVTSKLSARGGRSSVNSKSMSNSTRKRPTLKTRVQAPELVFTGQKSVIGEQHPYKQTVNKHILFFTWNIHFFLLCEGRIVCFTLRE
jgi:hypothetical protein